MEIVWLKRDVRLHDHGAFAQVAKSTRPLLILYNYEPDQLAEHSVHGSHVCFINEGLVDLDQRLSRGLLLDQHISSCGYSSEKQNVTKEECWQHGTHTPIVEEHYTFQVLTVCHAGIVFTLQSILQQVQQKGAFGGGGGGGGGIHRILTHEETGHLKSFARDKAVRRWCKSNSIPIMEYNQTGVTRCLKSRDDFTKHFSSFVHAPLWHTPTQSEIESMQRRLVRGLTLHGLCQRPLCPMAHEIVEIPLEHRKDRIDRQRGGESEGLASLESFLNHRGKYYASGISSPNTSWKTGGRISPYLSCVPIWKALEQSAFSMVLQKRPTQI
jgi:deoxyribodipyrimidine photo-lyase